MKAFAKLGILGFLVAMGAIFSACVDINLKSELPKVDYYTLDNISANAPHCGAYQLVALESIELPQSIAGKNILYKDGAQVRSVEGVRLNDSLKSNLESMLIKTFAKSCIKTITPPFSGIKVENFLRIKVLDFNAIKSAESSLDSANGAEGDAVISLSYQIYQNGVILQSDIIAESSKIDSFKGEVIFKALQDSANKAIKTLTNKMIPK